MTDLYRAIEFKKRYPRLYKKILDYFSDRKIFDKSAAIHLYLIKKTKPECELCGEPLSITRGLRNKTHGFRCAKHVNTERISADDIHQAAAKIGKTLKTVCNNVVKSTQITLVCPHHGEYTQTAQYLLAGGNCQKCYHENRPPHIDFQEWLADARDIHDDFYDYSHSVYGGTSKDIQIECPVHGVFTQNAGVHRRGHGCPKCAWSKNSQNASYDTEVFVQKSRDVHGDLYDYSESTYTGSRNTVTISCAKHEKFQQVAYYHLAGNGCPPCGIAKTTNKSAAEYELLEFLEDQDVSVTHSDRSLGFELDLLIPEYNLAMEYNGVYWHSSDNITTDAKHKAQHVFKTQECQKHGIQLLHILDTEWQDPIKQNIWKSMILHKLGRTHTNIGARKCTVKTVDATTSRQFLNHNHMQSECRSSIRLGLYYQNELVSLLTAGKARYSKKYHYEILRFCNHTHTHVQGGFTRLFRHFVNQCDPASVVSYGNRRWSQGNLYERSGFCLTSVSDPCYYYTDCKKIWHRSSFQKHMLSKKLKNFHSDLTEVENMYNHGYRRIWDSGNLVYDWSKT